MKGEVSKISSFRELVVWQKGIKLVKETYRISQKLPKSEGFGLVSQIQRAAVSIPSNIAEGYKRNNRKEYVQFLAIANASTAELETQLVVINEIYPAINTESADSLLKEVQKMLTVMVNKMKLNP